MKAVVWCAAVAALVWSASVAWAAPDAMTRAQARVAAHPADPGALAQLAAVYAQQVRETGDPSFYAKADTLAARALRIDATHEGALAVSGTLALSRHAFTEALALGRRARALYPFAAPFCGIVTDACIELGRYDDAAAALDTMMTLRPDLASYARVSYWRELHGDVDGALDAMQQAAVSGSAAAENVAWCQVQRGLLLLGHGRADEAARAFAAAHALLPHYAPALGGLARVALAQGREAAADSLFRHAIAVQPLPENLIALGELCEVRGRAAEAERRYALVRAVWAMQRAAGIDADIEFALFAADHPAPGASAESLIAAARAARDRRPSVKSDDVLAWTLYRAGRAAEADSVLHAALRLGTDDALLHYHAGMIAAALADAPRARAALHRALALSPCFTPCGAREARATLARLDALAEASR